MHWATTKAAVWRAETLGEIFVLDMSPLNGNSREHLKSEVDCSSNFRLMWVSAKRPRCAVSRFHKPESTDIFHHDLVWALVLAHTVDSILNWKHLPVSCRVLRGHGAMVNAKPPTLRTVADPKLFSHAMVR